MRALLSVLDKSGIVEFGQGLVDLGWEIISTGKTAAALRAAGIAVVDVAVVTGVAEMLDGRVKTLHPAIHGGLLARRDLPEHMAQLAEAGITPIDLVACNLYDFAGAVAAPDVTDVAAMEQVDIGGVTLLRAAAKNYAAVTVVATPSEYPAVLAALGAGEVPLEMRRDLAAKAFAHTANYDAQIAMYLAARQGDLFPRELALPLERIAALRYGENPHQRGAFYRWRAPGGVPRATLAEAETLHGKQLGYNNLMDLDAALNVVRDFAEPAAAIIKHTAPCGVAVGTDLVSAFRRALASDPGLGVWRDHRVEPACGPRYSASDPQVALRRDHRAGVRSCRAGAPGKTQESDPGGDALRHHARHGAGGFRQPGSATDQRGSAGADAESIDDRADPAQCGNGVPAQ